MNFGPYIIGIAGESGVGKSTISSIISLYSGVNSTTVISTDDLHKWERSNQVWSGITHLNPDANNLELGDMQLTDLANGRPIYRSIYSHRTGTFGPPQRISSKDILVVEGLHAFYTPLSQSLIDLKIFIDTDDDLRTHWKIIRDTEERGYRYNDVLEAINKRRLDSDRIRHKQLDIADVVIEMKARSKIAHLGDKSEVVEVEVIVHHEDTSAGGLLPFIQEYLADFSGFIKASEVIGHDVEMCQNGGGNISVKTRGFMIIKASGFNMKDVNRLNGYSVLNYDSMTGHEISGEHELNTTLLRAAGSYKRPSMETGMHALLGKYVLHAHPIYLTLLLCLENSKELIDKLYVGIDYQYIKYVNPGYELFDTFRRINRAGSVFFLENHGIVVSSDDLNQGLALFDIITERARSYISGLGLETFDVAFADRPTIDRYPFPDSIMFVGNQAKRETWAAHNYINIIGNKIGCVRHLSDHDVCLLRDLEAEKYRKSL